MQNDAKRQKVTATVCSPLRTAYECMQLRITIMMCACSGPVLSLPNSAVKTATPRQELRLHSTVRLYYAMPELSMRRQAALRVRVGVARVRGKGRRTPAS